VSAPVKIVASVDEYFFNMVSAYLQTPLRCLQKPHAKWSELHQATFQVDDRELHVTCEVLLCNCGLHVTVKGTVGAL
jgi:hypothetical protein